MGAITVYKFDTPDGAGQMLDLVKDLTKRQLIALDDAAIVTWPQGKKKPKAQHLQEKKQHSRALGGAFWGMLFGLIFGVPFFGMALGAGFSSLGGESPDYGISKDFINDVEQKVTEGTSALFLKTSGVEEAKVADAIKKKDWEFEIISTNLSKEHEQKLREEIGAE
jgi:uncharacterized membrane protein